MNTRIAVLGAGGVAQRHVAVLSSLADVDVVAVVDPILAAAEQLARHCDATPFQDVDQALDEVAADAVYVCVPPFAHGTVERSVLERRLPMFVEKPVALDLKTAQEIDTLVTESGVVTATGYHWRCLEPVSRARDLLADNPPLLATGSWLDKRPPVSWWASSHRSGGQVIEQLTHVLDLARLLLGEAVEVTAAGVRRAPSQGPQEPGRDDRGDIDDATVATVRFASGSLASFVATSALRAKHRAALHTISHGMLLELSEGGMVVDDGVTRHEHRPVEDPKVVVDREFIEAVRGLRESTRTPYSEAVRSHALGCAIATSARTGQTLRLA